MGGGVLNSCWGKPCWTPYLGQKFEEINGSDGTTPPPPRVTHKSALPESVGEISCVLILAVLMTGLDISWQALAGSKVLFIVTLMSNKLGLATSSELCTAVHRWAPLVCVLHIHASMLHVLCFKLSAFWTFSQSPSSSMYPGSTVLHSQPSK